MRTKPTFVVMITVLLGFSQVVFAQESKKVEGEVEVKSGQTTVVDVDRTANQLVSFTLTEKQRKQLDKIDAVIAELEKPRPDESDEDGVVFTARTLALNKKRKEREDLVLHFMRKSQDRNPVTREANKIVDRELDQGDKNEKEALREKNRMADLRRKVHLNGCGPETQISPSLDNIEWLGGLVKQIVKNDGDVPIYIMNEEGEEVVSGLCPGGSITLTRVLNTWRDGAYVQYQYTASANVEGVELTVISPSLNLNRYTARYQPRQYARPWILNFSARSTSQLTGGMRPQSQTQRPRRNRGREISIPRLPGF